MTRRQDKVAILTGTLAGIGGHCTPINCLRQRRSMNTRQEGPLQTRATQQTAEGGRAASTADAPTVPAQDLAATVAANYLSCRENAEQLTASQAWVTRQSSIF